MTLKAKMSLLVFLTSLSIVSIGFSSWSITAETTAEINGNIEVDNVINSGEYIYLNNKKGDSNSGIDTLDYDDSFFINSNTGLSSDTGTITTYLLINQEKCKNVFIGHSSLKVSLTIKYSDNVENNTLYNIFDNYYENSTLISGFNCSAKCSKEFSYSQPYNIDNKQYTMDFTFTNILKNYNSSIEISELPFEVTYSIFASNKSYYKTNILKLLETENMQFTVSAVLTSF